MHRLAIVAVLLAAIPLAFGQVVKPQSMIRVATAATLEAESCEYGTVAHARDTNQWYICYGGGYVPTSIRTCPESPPTSSCDVDWDDDGTDDKAQLCMEQDGYGTVWFCKAGTWTASSTDTLGGYDHADYLRRNENNATITGTGWSFTAASPNDVDFLNLALTSDHDGITFYDDFVATETWFLFKNTSGVFYLTSDADALDKWEIGDGTNVIDMKIYGSIIGDGSSEIKFDPDGDLADESKIDSSGNFTANAATATALAANGANCASGEAAAGVDASGAAETCDKYVTADASGHPDYDDDGTGEDLANFIIAADNIAASRTLYIMGGAQWWAIDQTMPVDFTVIGMCCTFRQPSGTQLDANSDVTLALYNYTDSVVPDVSCSFTDADTEYVFVCDSTCTSNCFFDAGDALRGRYTTDADYGPTTTDWHCWITVEAHR